MKTRRGDVSRRELMKAALTAEAAAIVGCSSHTGKVGTGHPLDAENKREGTGEWMLTNTRIDPKTKYRCPWIEGYCSHTSIRAGQELSIFVSTNPPAPFT